MKIRVGSILLAAVFFSLSSAIAAETNEPSFKTSYYDRTATLTITEWCSPNYVDPPQMTVWHDHYDWFSYNPPWDFFDWSAADTWVCREYCEKHFTFCTWPDATSGGTKHRWGLRCRHAGRRL